MYNGFKKWVDNVKPYWFIVSITILVIYLGNFIVVYNNNWSDWTPFYKSWMSILFFSYIGVHILGYIIVILFDKYERSNYTNIQ